MATELGAPSPGPCPALPSSPLQQWQRGRTREPPEPGRGAGTPRGIPGAVLVTILVSLQLTCLVPRGTPAWSRHPWLCPRPSVAHRGPASLRATMRRGCLGPWKGWLLLQSGMNSGAWELRCPLGGTGWDHAGLMVSQGRPTLLPAYSTVYFAGSLIQARAVL